LYVADKKTSDDELPPGMDEWRRRSWQWQEPQIEPEEAARVEAHAASIVSAERDELHAATDTLGALLGHAAREMIDDGISPVLADLLIERLAAGDYTGALDLCDSRTRAAAIVALGYALDNNDDIRAVLGRW